MLSKLIEFSLKNRLLVILVFAAMMGAGILTLMRIPIDAFPDTTSVQVQINAVAPALRTGINETDQVVIQGSFIVMSEFLKSRLGAGCTDG